MLQNSVADKIVISISENPTTYLKVVTLGTALATGPANFLAVSGAIGTIDLFIESLNLAAKVATYSGLLDPTDISGKYGITMEKIERNSISLDGSREVIADAMGESFVLKFVELHTDEFSEFNLAEEALPVLISVSNSVLDESALKDCEISRQDIYKVSISGIHAFVCKAKQLNNLGLIYAADESTEPYDHISLDLLSKANK